MRMRKYRSWLLVAGNDEELLGSAMATGADVVVVDLEDMVPQEHKRASRQIAAEWLLTHRTNVLEQRQMGRWVRINAMDSEGQWREDLLAIMPSAPDGIFLPKAADPEAVRQLAAEIYEIEQRNQVPANSTQIIPLVGETPQSALTIAQYLESAHQRLAGIAWTAQGLATSISATRSFDSSGGWTDAFRFVRAQTLLASHACGILPIDAAFPNYEDLEGLAQAARSARSDGFCGMLAVHPDQVAVINEAFAPTAAELEEARDIIAAFEGKPEAGSLQFQGKIIDKPHLTSARRVLGIGSAGNQPVLQRASNLRPA